MNSGRISLFGENRAEKSKDIMGNTGQTILTVGKVIGAGILLGFGVKAFNEARD